MSDLLKIVKKHNLWMGVVSHLRKGEKPFEEGHLPSIDDIKGSGSIKQISFDILAFARNMVAESVTDRNTIRLRVLKSRFTGLTGDCGNTCYNPETGRLFKHRFVDFE
jgi:twinkle protein